MVQALDGFGNAVIVELDTLAHGALHAGPVGLFETGLGGGGAFAKQTVMLVEPLDEGARDQQRLGGHRRVGIGDQLDR